MLSSHYSPGESGVWSGSFIIGGPQESEATAWKQSGDTVERERERESERSNNYPMSAHPLQLDTSLGPHTVCQICTQFDTFVVAVSTFLCTMGRVE